MALVSLLCVQCAQLEIKTKRKRSLSDIENWMISVRYTHLERYGLGVGRGWGMEVKKTSGVLADCPLAMESTNRSKDLFPE